MRLSYSDHVTRINCLFRTVQNPFSSLVVGTRRFILLSATRWHHSPQTERGRRRYHIEAVGTVLQLAVIRRPDPIDGHAVNIILLEDSLLSYIVPGVVRVCQYVG